MQVLLKPLTRQPLTEEEFYELGVDTTRARLSARLRWLLNWSNRHKARAGKGFEVEKLSQIPALAGCDLESRCMRPVHR